MHIHMETKIIWTNCFANCDISKVQHLPDIHEPTISIVHKMSNFISATVWELIFNLPLLTKKPPTKKTLVKAGIA